MALGEFSKLMKRIAYCVWRNQKNYAIRNTTKPHNRCLVTFCIQSVTVMTNYRFFS